MPNKQLKVFWSTVVGVAFCLGVAVALMGPGDLRAQRAIGAASIVAGLALLLMRNIFAPDQVVPAALQYSVRRRMRVVGMTSLIMGLAMVPSDARLRAILMTVAAVVSMAGVFKKPRRFFVLDGGAD